MVAGDFTRMFDNNYYNNTINVLSFITYYLTDSVNYLEGIITSDAMISFVKAHRIHTTIIYYD